MVVSQMTATTKPWHLLPNMCFQSKHFDYRCKMKSHDYVAHVIEINEAFKEFELDSAKDL
jgi:hypothetical protein